MTKEPAKGPTAKPVSVEDPLAKLIDKLSDEIEPVDVPTSVEEESVNMRAYHRQEFLLQTLR